MKPTDPCLFDSSIWIVGQNNPAWFATVVADLADVATCQAAVGEFCVGLYAPRQKATRDQVQEFFTQNVQAVACHPHLPDDFDDASRLIGQAIFQAAAKPSFPDGLIAACARRLGRIVWTTDEIDFKALGCRVFNPLTDPATRPESKKPSA